MQSEIETEKYKKGLAQAVAIDKDLPGGRVHEDGDMEAWEPELLYSYLDDYDWYWDEPVNEWKYRDPFN